MRRVLSLSIAALVVFAALPASAQRDRMTMGESLGAKIVRAQPVAPGVSVVRPTGRPGTTSVGSPVTDAMTTREALAAKQRRR